MEKNYGKGEIWRNYGGHRLWKSPEDEATYQPDHNPVEVVLCENGATFYSGDDKITGIRKGVKVTMSEAGDVTIEHTFFNCGKKTLRVALWGLSVMNQNSIAVIPMSKENTGYLANRNLVLWHYADVKDERLTIEQNYISVRQTPNCKGPIKIGTLNTEGIVYYIRNNKLVEKICDKADRNGNYVDYSCSTEIYSCKDFIEVENLSELYDIPVGAEASYKEVWKLHIEDKLYDSIKKMINEK